MVAQTRVNILRVTSKVSSITKLATTLTDTFTMGRAAKRGRKNKTDDVATDTEKATSLITCLPFELIAEVLLYSKSPADLLSLSRTCKHFHATLVQNPVATFIWKNVRAQMTPPLPDPTKLGFSETQLANFVYGEGKCTVSCISPHFILLTLTFRSRNAAHVHATCTHRFLPGFVSAGTRSVVRNIRQLTPFTAVSLDSRTPKEKTCSHFHYPRTRVVVTLD